MKSKFRLIGPFTQLLTMDNLPLRGPLQDDQLEIIPQAGILVKDNIIEKTGPFRELKSLTSDIDFINEECIALPGFIDAHTHICWAGSRANDYAMRLSGKSYSDIARQGGGIWSTVTRTRETPAEELINLTIERANYLLHQGVTTIEVKSGYGLDAVNEIKMLECIRQAGKVTKADLITTCLAAHIKPKDYDGSSLDYLEWVSHEILPQVIEKKLSKRVDIYIDKDAFTADEARSYLTHAKKLGFDLVIHADQFSPGGSRLAIEMGALSADHLEKSTEEDIRLIAQSDIIPLVLPGSSIGLGVPFAPARKLLNSGASLAIASDWNPGSAPMGDLLVQACMLSIFEKLSMAETIAGITFRAAAALNLKDRGIIREGNKTDFIGFNVHDYKEILYNQGRIKPVKIWKNGRLI